LITGAARGIGLAIAERFVQEGARVTIGDIRDDEGARAVDVLGAAARYEHLDVTDERQWERLAADR
jgi:3alpha(or 20beta)-hydroxysteroid dehydrogenase